MKKLLVILAITLSGCTTYNITDSSRTTIRVNDTTVVKRAPVKKYTPPKIRDCVNPYQVEKQECVVK